MKVYANADVPADALNARSFGAEGIGLCRTEHMFFERDRIEIFREMILAENAQGRKAALDKLLPIQRSDFEGLLRTMKGVPVTIRLLDPPLHEFVPHEGEAQGVLAKKLNIPLERVQRRVGELHEMNPMLGLRGCRLGITYPEVYNMQVRAIIEAAINITKEGISVHPEIMIPLVGKKEELMFTRKNAEETAQAAIAAAGGVKFNYVIGTMIEIPRACVTANEIAEEADFFSFGTNDLTQMGCGFSRDDAGPFLRLYGNIGIYKQDPFRTLDQQGVGQLMKIAVVKGRSTKPNLKMGICGEHGGDPQTIEFCHKVGLNYVSCSPFRVPVAIVAAAHATIKDKKKERQQNMKLAHNAKL
uniref:Pyruvate, phosphate dikinase n=1 Tax=Lygus hesperus TaxID=30085 RepID=A0A0A9WI91_LYGHE